VHVVTVRAVRDVARRLVARGHFGALVAVAVAVEVGVPVLGIHHVGVGDVDGFVAIVVDPVAELGRALEHRGVGVVAVGVVVHVVGGRLAVLDARAGIALPVAVRVEVQGLAEPFVR
jgi:hypothetical protein